MVVYCFQSEIVVTLFTAQYIESSFAFFLFMIVFYFSSIGSITGYSLVALNKNLLSFNANFVGVLTGVIASLILTPLFGFVGAVYGIILSRFISSGLGIFYLGKQFVKVSYLGTILPLLFCVPFIVTFELIGFTRLFYKILFVLTFIVIEIIIFKEFRNTLIKIFGLVKSSSPNNTKGLTKLK